jgi:cobalt-zinc-cadmium efflux system membrane fusion protein
MFSACNEKTINEVGEKSENNIESEENEGGVSPVTLTSQQVQALSIKADTLPKYVFKNLVAANGYLNVPPQNKASVTTVLGANISSINVFEGDEVSKGQVLAYLTHPGLIDVQTEYINAQNRLEFMEQEYKRQEKLYSEQISSGKTYQKTLADYYNLKGTVLNLEAKLKLLHLDPLKIKKGSIYEKAPVLSPINGFVEKVNIRTGQFAEPQKTLFEIVDNRKIHADLMVFEKDIYKVKTGQKVVFEVESVPMSPMTATIFAVGKSFEQNPKAVHIHAKIDNKQGVLIPGMYITARIATGNKLVNALPEEAVVNEGGKSYIFTVEEKEGQWVFTPVEIIRGNNEEGWSEIRLLSPKGPNTKFAWNGAYYLLSEMKKDETGDDD